MTDLVDRLRRKHGLTHDPDQLWDVISTLTKERHDAADEILALRRTIERLRGLVERADHLAHGVFKAQSKSDDERNRHNAAVLCNAIAKERNSGGVLA